MPHHFDKDYWMRMVFTHGAKAVITLLDDIISGAEKKEEYEKANDYLNFKKELENLHKLQTQ